MFSWMRKAKNLPASTPIHVDEGSLFDRLRKSESEIPPGDYGMWFSSEGDDTFSRSDTFEAIDRIYRAVAGREEAALAEILAHLGNANSESLRMPLPESPLVVPALVAASNADAGLCILISASKEKGIRFHFPRSATPSSRVELLSAVAAFLEARRNSSSAPPPASSNDDDDERSGARWWTAMKITITDQEARGELSQAVGKVTYR